MKVTQISVFLENKSGRLADVARVLGENGVNIRALSIADTSDFGILRLIVDDPTKAATALTDEGFTLSLTDVIAVKIPDHPGGLAKVLNVMKSAGVNIEYMYAFVTRAEEGAVVVFRVEQLASAISVLTAEGISLLTGKDVYEL